MATPIIANQQLFIRTLASSLCRILYSKPIFNVDSALLAFRWSFAGLVVTFQA